MDLCLDGTRNTFLAYAFGSLPTKRERNEADVAAGTTNYIRAFSAFVLLNKVRKDKKIKGCMTYRSFQ